MQGPSGETISQSIATPLCRTPNAWERRQEATLADIGYSIPGHSAIPDEVAQLEDDMADAICKYAMHLIGNRIARELWMFSWPTKSVFWCDEAIGEHTRTMRELCQDFDLHSVVECARENKEVAGLQAISERSTFHLLPVRQLALMARGQSGS